MLLIPLIVFILQNPTKAEVQFLGVEGTLLRGMALLIAAVTGGAVVAIARATQLRMNARRTRDATSRAQGSLDAIRGWGDTRRPLR